MRGILLIIVVLIVYGSLYPWDFIFDSHTRPVRVLLTSWIGLFHGDFPTRDFVVNVALYAPFGMAGFLALQKPAAVLALACAMSTSIELIQAYHPLRYSSALDLVANLAGCALGVLFAKAFQQNLHRLAGRWCFIDSPSPVPMALFLVWAATTTFPFFPETGPTTVLNKLSQLLNEPIQALSVISGIVVSLTLGRLLIAAGVSSPNVWLGAAAWLVPAQLLLRTRQPSSGAVAGAIVGCVTFILAGRLRYANYIGAIAVMVLIVCRGLIPFDFQSTPTPFGWIPFAGLLESEDGQRGLTILLEKCFYYGAAIWSLHACGLGLSASTLVTAIILALVETAQMWIPGRTPEVTDVVLAAVLCLTFRSAGGEVRR